jgi:hypothetical protein
VRGPADLFLAIFVLASRHQLGKNRMVVGLSGCLCPPCSVDVAETKQHLAATEQHNSQLHSSLRGTAQSVKRLATGWTAEVSEFESREW